ncbi:hypothetical protein IHQ11_13290 [Priestia megaterium]|uniref:hypothetical protein n=1 Tax=Priestia megaterium TaxID=1404 RepID=UPI001B39E580|nr:hypothetical protein [Priestia megaterium]MBQ4867473.1 hypothetical protein [Priestia megaterium]
MKEYIVVYKTTDGRTDNVIVSGADKDIARINANNAIAKKETKFSCIIQSITEK